MENAISRLFHSFFAGNFYVLRKMSKTTKAKSYNTLKQHEFIFQFKLFS